LIKENHEADLLSRPGVIGVGVGKVSDEPEETETAIIVYVSSNGKVMPRNLKLPTELEGTKVRVIFTDPFVAR